MPSSPTWPTGTPFARWRSPFRRSRRRPGRAQPSACGKLFAWAARERDGGGLGVRVDREEKHLLLQSNPDAYFSSPHYNGYPGLQIRLERIDDDELRDRLEDAWLIQAPKRLAREYLAANE